MQVKQNILVIKKGAQTKAFGEAADPNENTTFRRIIVDNDYFKGEFLCPKQAKNQEKELTDAPSAGSL